ncbi:hypothetical protein KRR26_05910 [Corallococcus sp. M34]|uniref:hypothetical protein n=1 Tax=Citreicoccus inhibens TaxID=2849499 RepID=UPI0013157934|nr:hypothetical protein [Citreicoccus inhibens]MBU8895129.1 hypothetical protein [Citreicoccus inhibens]
MVNMEGVDADGSVVLNGVNVLAGLSSADKKSFTANVTLPESNTLTVSALSGPGSRVRAAVFDADILPPPLTMYEPEEGAFFTVDEVPAGR